MSSRSARISCKRSRHLPGRSEENDWLEVAEEGENHGAGVDLEALDVADRLQAVRDLRVLEIRFHETIGVGLTGAQRHVVGDEDVVRIGIEAADLEVDALPGVPPVPRPATARRIGPHARELQLALVADLTATTTAAVTVGQRHAAAIHHHGEEEDGYNLHCPAFAHI